ncbi:MAG: hypothetical protein PHW90_00560 [Bacilli bacterium]|nr:hypothetical protein [Bacilli bacterium]
MKKKNVLILGGNSKNNIAWIHKVRKVFTRDYKVNEICYDHWKNNNEINFDVELKKLEKITHDIKDYYIVSKSIGSIIALIGIEKQIINPKGIVILGFPLKYLQKINLNIKQLLNNVINETEILVIQQKNDPIGKCEEVIKELPANIRVIEIPGNHHVYSNMNSIKPLVDQFFKNKTTLSHYKV